MVESSEPRWLVLDGYEDEPAAFVFLSDEHKPEAFGLASRSGRKHHFVHGGMGSDKGLELLGCG